MPTEEPIRLNPIKEFSNICRKCGAENTLEGTYYQHKHYHFCTNCNRFSSGITKTEWKKRKKNYYCSECKKEHRYDTKIWRKHKRYAVHKKKKLEKQTKAEKYFEKVYK